MIWWEKASDVIKLGFWPKKRFFFHHDSVWGSDNYGLIWMDFFEQKIDLYREHLEEDAGVVSFFSTSSGLSDILC